MHTVHTAPRAGSPVNGVAISLQDLPVYPAGQVNSWRVVERERYGERETAGSTRGNASYRFRLASFMHIHGGDLQAAHTDISCIGAGGFVSDSGPL